MRSKSKRRQLNPTFERLESRSMLSASTADTDLLVNGYTPGVQAADGAATSVAMSSSGGIVVFQGRGAGDRDGVYARRLSSDGTPTGSDFRVNQTTQGLQGNASVAMRSDGSFVVVWDGRGQGDKQGVFLRIYSASGSPLTDEILVNQSVAGDQSSATVAIAADGTIVVAWCGYGAGDNSGIFMRRFNSQGSAQGAEVLVNGASPEHQVDPALAMQSDGSFLIAWTSRGQDGSDNAIVARRFSAAGQPSGAEFIVNSQRSGDQVTPAVAALASGAYQVVWASYGDSASGWDIRQTQISATGEIAAETAVHTATAGHQTQPKIAVTASGNMVITWTSVQANGAGREVRAREFTSSGSAVAAEFGVPADASGARSGQQSSASIATAGEQVLVVWSGRGAVDRKGVYVSELQEGDETENHAPNLADIPDRTGTVGTEITLTATATDPDGDELTFSLDPEQAPTGATIDPATGVFRWTPTAPGTYVIRVLVTDNGNPALADSETFTITVAASTNQAPDLADIPAQSVEQGSELTFTATATDPDGDSLTFSLDPEQAPAGATIDPATGVFRWTPGAEQGPGTYTVRVLVTDSGNPALADSETFTITVTAANLPPDLQKPEDQEIAPGEELVVNLVATDDNGPSDTLTYSIDPETQLPGVSINPSTGELRWQVPADFAPGEYQVRVLVTDSGSPALADSEVFWITVIQPV